MIGWLRKGGQTPFFKPPKKGVSPCFSLAGFEVFA